MPGVRLRLEFQPQFAVLTTTHTILQDAQRALEQQLTAAETQIAGLEVLVDTLRHTRQQRVADAAKAHLRAEAADQRAHWQQQLAGEKDRAADLDRALSLSQAEGERLSAALATEKERSDQAQAQANRLREQQDQLMAHDAQLDEHCHSLQTAVEQERARSHSLVAEKDARIADQIDVIATLNAALQRAPVNVKSDDTGA